MNSPGDSRAKVQVTLERKACLSPGLQRAAAVERAKAKVNSAYIGAHAFKQNARPFNLLAPYTALSAHDIVYLSFMRSLARYCISLIPVCQL